jgi:hypothetical protein
MGKVRHGIIQNGLHAFFDDRHIHATDNGFVQFVDKLDEALVLGIDLRDADAQLVRPLQTP